MTRRLEAGPLLVAIAAPVLFVSLFLDWFDGGLTAWHAFEVWDLVLAVLAAAALAMAVGGLAPDVAALDRRWQPAVAVAVVLVVVTQLLDPPPAALGDHLGTGAWLALAAALGIAGGTVLTFSRVRLAFDLVARETVRVPAVDVRGEEDEDDDEPVAARRATPSPFTELPSRERLFGRFRSGGAPAGEAGDEDDDVTREQPAARRGSGTEEG
jgi:hypothetical protein